MALLILSNKFYFDYIMKQLILIDAYISYVMIILQYMIDMIMFAVFFPLQVIKKSFVP